MLGDFINYRRDKFKVLKDNGKGKVIPVIN
jgi:hypothetical protein